MTRTSIWRHIAAFLRDEGAQSPVEYAIILSFVSIATIGLFMGSGQDVKHAWEVANNQLVQANAGTS